MRSSMWASGAWNRRRRSVVAEERTWKRMASLRESATRTASWASSTARVGSRMGGSERDPGRGDGSACPGARQCDAEDGPRGWGIHELDRAALLLDHPAGDVEAEARALG